MKTLKISLVATAAVILAWRVHLPQKFWPAHPQLAGLLLGAVLCIVLQLVWSDPVKQKSVNSGN